MAPYMSSLDENEAVEPRYEDNDSPGLSQVAFWYLVVLIVMLLTWLLLFSCLRVYAIRQKTRNPQQRRMYAGSRARPSLTTHEPTIYVSPSNLPPPPKYECMAPPSYEEVVGVHYPNHQAQQPIAHPITTALAQSTNNNTRTVEPLPATGDSPPPAIDQVPAPASLTAVNERQS